MAIWDKLFNKVPKLNDIKIKIKEVERDQKKVRRSLSLLEDKKDDLVRRAMKAKKDGRQEELRHTFREIRGLEIDAGFTSKDLQRYSLTMVALKSMERKIARLEQNNDQKSIQNLILRFKNSKIQSIIDKGEIEEDAFVDQLDEVLGEEEESINDFRMREDSGFAEFEKTIGAMVDSEDTLGEDPDEYEKFKQEINKAVKTKKSPEY